MYPNHLKISPEAHIAKESVIVGDITIGKGSSVFYHCTLRADGAPIIIGEGTNIQDNTVIHVDPEDPTIIGDGVTVGHSCIIHGCEIGNETLIGMGSTILNGAKIGKNCLIGANSLVTQNAVIPDGMLALGSPAKVKRPLTEEELANIYVDRDEYIELSKLHFGDYGDR